MIDYLFEETYYFQSILGVERYELNQKTSNILLDYLEQYPERREIYLKKTMDFLTSEIETEEYGNINTHSDLDFLKIRTESVVRFFLDVFLMLYEKFGFIDELYKKLKIVSGQLYSNTGMEYSYLLNEEKYHSIADLFNN